MNIYVISIANSFCVEFEITIHECVRPPPLLAARLC